MLHRQFQGVNFSFMDYSLEILILPESWKLGFSIGALWQTLEKQKYKFLS